MNNQEFWVQESMFVQQILRLHEARIEAGYYQGIASNNGNFGRLARHQLEVVKMLEESLEIKYETYHSKHLSCAEIEREYALLIEQWQKNLAQVEYPNEGLNK